MSLAYRADSASAQLTAVSLGRHEKLFVLLILLQGLGVIPTQLANLGVGFGGALTTGLWLALYAVAAAKLMLQHGINWISWLGRYRFLLLALMAGVVVSISWSLDPILSASRVFHLLGCTLVAAYIGYSMPLFATQVYVRQLLLLLIAISFVLGNFFPSVGQHEYEGARVWRGIFLEKNQLGFASLQAALMVVLFGSGMIRIVRIGAALLCIYVLIMSHSATALVAFLVALGVVASFRMGQALNVSRFGLLILLSLLLSIGLLVLVGAGPSAFLSVLGRDSNLTGRGEVWEQVIQLLRVYPWTGTGYGTLWAPTDTSVWLQQWLFDFKWTVYHAHNGVLHMASQIGIPLAVVGVLFAVQMLAEAFGLLLRMPNQPIVEFLLATQIALLLSNVSESNFLTDRSFIWIYPVALSIAMLRAVERPGRPGVSRVVASVAPPVFR